MSDSINLGQLIGKDHKYDVSISNESPEDASARRTTEAADAAQKRHIALTLFWFALAFVSILFLGCAYVFATGAPEDKKWAAGIVSAIASGLVGFLVGQGKK
jgi:cytochrome oxidase assembly protein ShyY1